VRVVSRDWFQGAAPRALYSGCYVNAFQTQDDEAGGVERPSEVDLSARPKRLPSIARKLLRITTRLSQMEDIGGCRAKLPDAARVQAVLASVVARWSDARVDDYTASPQPTGYRAVHVVVIEGGRRIEIQLRTPGQNRWADEVERWSDRLGYALRTEKDRPS
jgi:ppGpp synthetase/RelA/SpoT-type nucleotidyltranferase